jgi:hypothetical protein
MKSSCLNRNFGIEIEVGNEKSQSHIQDIVESKSNKSVLKTEKWAQSIDNNFWHIKYDSTCGVKGKPDDNGWEIASFKAFGKDDLTHICDIADALKESGCMVNKNCGLHIHADVSDFNTTKMGSLLNRWIKIEKFLLHAMPDHRKNNVHCKPLISKLNVKNLKVSMPDSTWNLLRPKVFKIHNNPQKRFSLNLINYAKFIKYNKRSSRPTIELRLPEGTLNWDDIFNWTYFYLNFINFSFKNNCIKNLSYVKNVKSFFSISGINYSQNENLKLWFEERFKNFGK